MTSPQLQTPALPSSMERKLRTIRRRLAVRSVVEAVAWGASALILAMIGSMIVDWSVVLFDSGARTALTSISVLLAVTVVAVVGVRRLIDAVSLTRAAMEVDSGLPHLEERWTTVATFGRTNGRPMSLTTEAMLQQVTSEAVALGDLVRPKQITRSRSLWPPLLALGATGLLLIGFLSLNWQQTSVLLRRFWSPSANITATRLASLTGDQIVPRGESVDLIAQLSGLPRNSAELTIRYPSGIVDAFELRRDPEDPQHFLHSLRVDDSFRYRVRAGDGRTEWHSVTAIDYPEFETVHFRITPPDYIDRPPYEKAWLPSRVKVPQGSRLQLLMKPRQNLARLELFLTLEPTEGEPAEKTIALAPEKSGLYRFETQLVEDMSLSPRLFSLHGLTNETRHLCRIEVVSDMAPIARVITPTNEMTVAENDVVDIKFEAHDDHAVASAELVIYDESNTEEGDEPKILAVEPIDLGDQAMQKHVMAQAQLDLKKYGLEDGRKISYAIRVTDNRMLTIDPDDNAHLIAGAEAGNRPQNEAETPQSASAETAEDVETALADNRDPSTQNTTNDARNDTPAKANAKNGTAGDSNENPKSVAAKDSNDANRKLDVDTSANELTDNPSNDEDSKIAKTNPSDKEADAAADNGEPTKPTAEGDNADSEPSAVAQRGDTPESDGTDAEKASAKRSESQTETGNLAPLSPQSSDGSQNVETNRQRLNIAERLSAVAASADRKAAAAGMRDKIEQIDALLADVETNLNRVIERTIPDADRGTMFQRLDAQLGDVETAVAELRNVTRETQNAFIGLQMVEIGRSHVTPARDAIFAASQSPAGADGNAAKSLQHVERARQLLGDVLKRYDEVTRDRELADSLDEAVKIYQVFVEKRFRLMREIQQNKNPLERKMGVVEVDQAYLDRYAEVLKLRREMLAEFARMLGDDPRLASRYLDLIKRRSTSLRNRLTQLHDRQDELAAELSGWLSVDDAQRNDLWRIVVDMRLQSAETLAREAAAFAERLDKQIPLVLDGTGGTRDTVIELAGAIAQTAHAVALDVRALYERTEQLDWSPVAEHSRQLLEQLQQLQAALDRLGFENESEQEVVTYVAGRLLERQVVVDRAESWARYLTDFQGKAFHSLAETDQRTLGIATELLRVQMLTIQDNLADQFRREGDGAEVPPEILNSIAELQQVMESVTYNQTAAAFSLSRNALSDAERQHARALEGFDKAEELFDKIRRAVIAALDEYDVPDPDISALQDPTLDRFLEQLTGEPDAEALLGIPRRPTNLRAMADTMIWQQEQGDMLNESALRAAARARRAMKKQQKKRSGETESERDPMDEENPPESTADVDDLKKMLEQSLKALDRKSKDQKLTADQRKKLEQTAENLRRLLKQGAAGNNNSARNAWKRIAESDEAKATLQALGQGKPIPDQQWNKILSSLDEGLWQVKGRKPPEEYRKSIEQYQDRIRSLLDAVESGVDE